MWLNGQAEPKLHSIEKILLALGYIPVTVPYDEVGRYGSHLRDNLGLGRKDVFDLQPDDPGQILANVLKLLQTKLIDLEKKHTTGRITSKGHLNELHKLVQDIRGILDAMAKTRVADRWAGGVDHVEFRFGSPKGTGKELLAKNKRKKE